MTDETVVQVADPIAEFGNNCFSLLDLLCIRFPDCTATAQARTKFGELRDDNERLRDYIGFWLMKMHKHMRETLNKEKTALAKVATIQFFDTITLSEKYTKLDSASRENLWVRINNCNCMALHYDEKDGDKVFQDITCLAQRLAVMFPKESLREKGYMEVMRQIPSMLGDQKMLSLIQRLCMSDERMTRVYNIIELQYKQEIPVTQRTLMTAAMRQMATGMQNDQTRQLFTTAVSAVPDLWQAGKQLLGGIMDKNPAIQSLLDNPSLRAMFGVNAGLAANGAAAATNSEQSVADLEKALAALPTDSDSA